jgi:hypothetical protein
MPGPDLAASARRCAANAERDPRRSPPLGAPPLDHGEHHHPVGVAVVLLVLTAAALAVAFATRGAMAGSRDSVEVLHLVGANDAFIAREFQSRFVRLGLKGGAIGGWPRSS